MCLHYQITFLPSLHLVPCLNVSSFPSFLFRPTSLLQNKTQVCFWGRFLPVPIFNRVWRSHLGSPCTVQTSSALHRFCTPIYSSELPWGYPHLTVPHHFRHLRWFLLLPLHCDLVSKADAQSDIVQCGHSQYWLDMQRSLSGMGCIWKCRHSLCSLPPQVLAGVISILFRLTSQQCCPKHHPSWKIWQKRSTAPLGGWPVWINWTEYWKWISKSWGSSS